MVTARLAIGSVSTVAFGALLLGSAPFWLNRSAGGSHATPWGAISALAGSHTAPAQSEEERTQLLKLAALKSNPAPEQPSAPVIQPVVSQSEAVPATAAAPQPVALMDASPAQTSVMDGAPSAATPPAVEPQRMASAESPAPAESVQSGADAATADRININTASSSALDRLPGAGRIGHTIVSHRPYKSVKDLVNRRVLRMSDFQKIQSHISAD